MSGEPQGALLKSRGPAVNLWIRTEKEARARGEDVTGALLALARVPTKPGTVPA